MIAERLIVRGAAMAGIRKMSGGERVLLGSVAAGFMALSKIASVATLGLSKTITGTSVTDYDSSTQAMWKAAMTGEMETDE